MKITKISHLGASESIKLQTTYHHGGDEDGEKEFHQKYGAEIFLRGYAGRSLAHGKTFQNDVLRRPYMDSTLGPAAEFATSTRNHSRLRRSLTRFARLHFSFACAPTTDMCPVRNSAPARP